MLGGQALINKEPPNFKVTKTVGLISDTHVPKRARCIPKKVFEIFERVDYIIHAGDLVDLSVVDELEQIAPVLAVHGNMDGLEVAGALPRLNSLKVFDWKIGVVHDQNLLYGSNKMQEIAEQNHFDVIVYGHTHVASIKWEGKILYINPGSPTDPSSLINKPSVGLLKITKETITPQIVEF
ncbi:MAG: metallophosphoesterase [Candidatus Bathyarchaeota archaeon]|nr:metallophosphoesterase [Candidatus Bathyarchaeota archaeon]